MSNCGKLLLLALAWSSTALQLHLDTPEFMDQHGYQRISAVLSLQDYDYTSNYLSCSIAYALEAGSSWHTSDKNEREVLLRLSPSELMWRLTAAAHGRPYAVRAECSQPSGVTVVSNTHVLRSVARRATGTPVIQSITITGSVANAGQLGVSLVTFDMTVDNMGPEAGPAPAVNIAGFPCSNVVRTGPSTLSARAPPSVGGGYAITVTVGTETSSTVGAPTFNYPRPDIATVDILTFTEWSNLAGPILSSTPRTLKNSATLVSPAGARPRGATLDVRNTGDVVLLKGSNFGPWVGNGSLSFDLGTDNMYWETYEASPAQCIATPWPGRPVGAQPPLCNQQWDYITEGELPSPGTIMYWSDTLVAFRAPPACPGLREVVISTGGVPGEGPVVITSMTGKNAWDIDVLLRYGGAQFRVDTLTGPVNDVSTSGTTTLTLTGPAFALSSSCGIASSSSMPASYSASLTMPPPAWAMQMVHIANADAAGTVVPQGMDVCAQAPWSAQSPFAQELTFMSGPPAVPGPCQAAAWTGLKRVDISYGAGGAAQITIPAGNGVNIRLMAYVYDAVRSSATGVSVQRWATDGTAASTSTPLSFSYGPPVLSAVDCGTGAWPSMCLTRRLFSVVSPGQPLQTNFELFLRAQNMGSEEVGGCTTGGGAFITLQAAFEPLNSSYARYPGGDDKLVSTGGGFLPKTFTGATADCSQVVGTSGYIPTMAVGRYGIALTATSPAGTRVGRLPASDGVAYTCGAGTYGKVGQICATCLTGTIGNCPGGPTSLVAGQLPAESALDAPIRAASGLYNYDGPRAAACPPNTPVANRPAGRDVCIAPCTPRDACAGANNCNPGYEDVPGVWGCSKCASTYVRVIAHVATCVGAASALVGVNGTCRLATDCTAVGGLVNAPLPGGNGENVCSCVPAASSTPTSTATAAAGASSSSTVSASPSPAGPTITATPTPTIPSNTCSNGVQNTGETDVDCGGACQRCSLGNKCRVSSDCRGENSEVVCSASTALCTDVRAGAAYWNSQVASHPVKHTITQLAVTFRLNFTLVNTTGSAALSDFALSPPGLDGLSRGVAAAVLTRLETPSGAGNVPWITVSTVRVEGTVSEVLRVGSQTRPSAQARRLSGTLPVFTQNASVAILVILSPTRSASLEWATEVRDAITQGALDATAMMTGITAALSNSAEWSTILRSQPRGTSPLTVPPARSSSVTALLPVVSVEAAAAGAAPPAGPSAGGAVGAVIVVVLLVVGAGFVFYVLRTNGEFAGFRMRYFATVCGLWPLHPKVVAQVRMRRPQKKAKTTTTAESYLGGKSLTSIPLVIPTDAQVTPSAQKKVQMNPIGVATQQSQRIMQGAASPQRSVPAGTMNSSARQIGSSRQLATTSASSRSLQSSGSGQRAGGLATSPSQRAAMPPMASSKHMGSSHRGGPAGRGGTRV